MSLPADGVNANTLAETTTIPTGKKLIFLDPDTNEGGIITLENLTKQILSNLTSQTFNLDQGNKTLLAALNELNSNFCTGIINNSICDCRYIKSGKNVSIWFGSAMTQLEQDKKYEIATLPDLVKTAGNFEIEITGNGRKYKIGINGKGVLTLTLLDKNTGVAPFVGASFCYPIIR